MSKKYIIEILKRLYELAKACADKNDLYEMEILQKAETALAELERAK